MTKNGESQPLILKTGHWRPLSLPTVVTTGKSNLALALSLHAAPGPAFDRETVLQDHA